MPLTVPESLMAFSTASVSAEVEMNLMSDRSEKFHDMYSTTLCVAFPTDGSNFQGGHLLQYARPVLPSCKRPRVEQRMIGKSIPGSVHGCRWSEHFSFKQRLPCDPRHSPVKQKEWTDAPARGRAL